MFRPSLGLITLAKEKKYVPKLKRKDELADLDAEPEGLNFQKVGVILGVTAVLGVCGGLAYSVVGGSVEIGPGIGLGLLFAAGPVGLGGGVCDRRRGVQREHGPGACWPSSSPGRL